MQVLTCHVLTSITGCYKSLQGIISLSGSCISNFLEIVLKGLYSCSYSVNRLCSLCDISDFSQKLFKSFKDLDFFKVSKNCNYRKGLRGGASPRFNLCAC